MDNDEFHDRHTRHFTPDASVGWAFAIATLERLGGWSVDAVRLGTLHLLQQCIRSMATPGGNKKLLLARAKELLDALDHLPWNDAPSAAGSSPRLVIRTTTPPPRAQDR